ncbi:ARM repeat-containing protein [Yamadazyma tenuis ATCC 10573]|uniref:non-specific serine/threonine protein kinase n=1 Tax=Candida tenuis (strain ATCC 10573 / BCRC 21748 / CBS 615 / JCM 9827 / NBRC 10315 / NRRL Y-1498 / VKM Y-70) TaxID=590646 RepID=G3BBK9_CANTC|nr:ARM repeat-containing protein [Yamadazyma tenuis ATCC 10573]EGV61563.1 ARM repeat-containing protein [Yamadazyma tenuis ATCC 10573]
MGARLSLLAPSAPTVAISSYVDIFDNIQYVELINNSRFLKTIKAIDLNTGDAIIIKILIKPSNNVNSFNINLQEYTELMVKEASLLDQFNCYLPTNKFIETDRAAYLIRQLVKTNLYDRLSIRPFLEPIEKNFIAFQMLKIIDNLHSNLHIRHGDLKLENFMVSSSNWIMLADFASYSKPVYIPEDNPNQFSFYFDTSDRRVCNLAPERFYNSGSESEKLQNFDENDHFTGKNQITEQMDLFSLGCIIGELYLDGEPLFTLSGLFRYIKKEYTPDLSGIPDAHVRDMILKLISFNPNQRQSAKQLLSEYQNLIFPQSFYSFLYDFIRRLNDNNEFKGNENDRHVTPSDNRIDYIHKNFDKISYNLKFDYSVDALTGSMGMNLNLPGMPKNYQIRKTSSFQDIGESQQSSLIILNFVFSLMNTLKQPASKIKACELITALSERVNDACKLDRSLPYLCKLIDEYIERFSFKGYDGMSLPGISMDENTKTESYSSKVVVAALDAIATILDSCSYISPLNVSMTSEYLLPKLVKLISSDNDVKESELVKIKLASCVPHLAEVANRFWMMAKTFKTKPLGSVHEGEQNGANQGNASVSKENLYLVFEEISSLLLTDPNPKVRAALVDNIKPLCRFFGVDKTNDIILPHLITYLNDPDIELKLHFLKSILFIGPYVGVLSFEQYLLPLLLQTLSDSEQLVVLEVIEIFVNFVSSRLINPASEFNALNIYKELLSNTVHFFLHPNEWIRQSVLQLVLSINANLSNADRFCFLYPQIKAYLTYDVTNINWDSLYPCLTKPLTKVMYQMLLNWASAGTEKSLFWKQESMTMTSPSKFTTFSKNLGKSVFVPSRSNGNSFSIPNRTSLAHSSIPLTHDDKQWLLKLKAVGLEEKDFWKPFMLRAYVLQVSRGMSLHIANSVGTFSDVNAVEIKPRNIFFEVSYKSEVVTSASNGLSSNVPQDSITKTPKTGRSGSNSLVLPNFSKVTASIQTIQENVFGELELNNDSHGHGNLQSNKYLTTSGDSNITHKVISSNDEKVIISNMKHSYQGLNPHILHYLQNVDFELSINSFSEFGDPVKINEPKSADWVPEGKCISLINTNSDPRSPDSLVCIAVNPSSEFFVTGSESGILKVWDSSKLEKNIMVKTPSLTAQFKSAIIKVCFMKNRNIFAVSTIDGRIRLFRVDVSRGKNKKILKYSKLVLIRKYDLHGEYATLILFNYDNIKTTMIVATSKSRILSFNVITMKREFELQNPLVHGVPTSVILDSRKGWLLTGTDKGLLCLWDIRFSVLVKSCKIISRSSSVGTQIKQLILLSPDFRIDSSCEYFAAIGGTSDPVITIWEIPTLECREILSPYEPNPTVQHYSIEEIKDSSNSVKDILNELPLDLEQARINDNLGYMKMYKHISGVYIVNSISSGRLIFWKLDELERSISNSGYTFTRTMLNQRMGFTNEKASKTLTKDHQNPVKNLDVINDIGFVSIPYEIVVTADRGGVLKIVR